MHPENIIVLDGGDLAYVIAILRTAQSMDQRVSFSVDDGLKVKRGQSMWTPPLGKTLVEYEGICARHGGQWGDDKTCAACTHDDGSVKPR